MRSASKTLAGALAVFLLALGLVACGGGSDDSSTSATEAGQSQSEGSAAESGSQAESGSDEGSEGQSQSSARKSEAAEFKPKQHNDSGGGSQQFIVKGGDNSVQEFGEEADQEEFEAAAAVLHDFLDARAEGNWAAACEYMSASIVETFAKLANQAQAAKHLKDTSCAGILEVLTNPGAKSAMKQEAEQADAGSLRVEGERSFVIYKGPEGTVMAMPMANEDGDWKVAGLAGTPLN